MGRIKRRRFAFTLIELLIVVAIIAILAAIAVPNFLEAQVRAKVSRCKTDIRSIATALESYRIDHNQYPHLTTYFNLGHDQWNRGGIHHVTPLSTPVAYLSNVDLLDPFVFGEQDEYGDVWPLNISKSYHYLNLGLYREEVENNGGTPPPHFSQWGLLSLGPDYDKGPNPHGGGWTFYQYCNSDNDPDDLRFALWEYDSTNGTRSNGDILRWQ